MNEILTPEDIRKELKISKPMAYKLIRNHEIKAFKIGREYRIPRKYLQEYIDKSIMVILSHVEMEKNDKEEVYDVKSAI